MSIPRIYQSIPLHLNATIILSKAATHHLIHVLRKKLGDTIIVFNGTGTAYQGCITGATATSTTVLLTHCTNPTVESPLQLILAQGIARGEKMDYILQKSVELGVSQIIPVLTEYCNMRLSKEQQHKKHLHWQTIMQSACEQSGRTRLATLMPVVTLPEWLATCQAELKLALHPGSQHNLTTLRQAYPTRTSIALLIGPEGGLSEQEIILAQQQDFQLVRLGPRILRTETAAIAMLGIAQLLWGDLS